VWGVRAHQEVRTNVLMVDLKTVMAKSQYSGTFTRSENKCDNENNGPISFKWKKYFNV